MKLKIRQEREDHNWTQENVAEQIGITKQAVQQIESNQVKPSYGVLVQLENLFQMNHRDLFGAATPDNAKHPADKQS